MHASFHFRFMVYKQTFSMNLMCDATVVSFGSGDANLNAMSVYVRKCTSTRTFHHVVSTAVAAAAVSMSAGYHHTFYVVETAVGRTGGRT